MAIQIEATGHNYIHIRILAIIGKDSFTTDQGCLGYALSTLDTQNCMYKHVF